MTAFAWEGLVADTAAQLGIHGEGSRGRVLVVLRVDQRCHECAEIGCIEHPADAPPPWAPEAMGERIRRLYARERNATRVAGIVGLSVPVVCGYLRRAGVPLDRWAARRAP